jgi:hypothetical protein
MPAMHAYRCYLLDASDHVALVELIRCPDDDAAKLRARDILAGQPQFSAVEVWQRARQVNREP